jgi:hypothetical protein
MRTGEKRRAVARPLVTMAIVAAAAVVFVGGAVIAMADVYWG